MPEQSLNTPSHPVRLMTPDDLEAVVDLSLAAWEPVFLSFENQLGTVIFERLYRPHWREAQAAAVRGNCLAQPDGSYVSEADDGAVAGFLVLARDHELSLGVVEMIAVHPAYQRRGHARALLLFAIQLLRAEGLALINVGTGGDPGHAPARALYEAVGFTGLPLVNYYLATP